MSTIPDLNLQQVREPNPFKVEMPKEFDDPVPLTTRSDIQKKKRISLIERSLIKKPSVPTSTRSLPTFRQRQLEKLSSISENPSQIDLSNYQRPQNVKEILSDKRKVFRDQLLINIKNVEISKIEKEIENSEKQLQDEYENSLNELTNIERHSNEVNSMLNNQIKSYEQVKSNRFKIERDLKYKKSAVERLKAEKSHYEGEIEACKECYDFMQLLPRPDDCEKPTDYYKDTQQILDYFNSIEEESKFLCNEMETLKTQNTATTAELKRQINEYDEKIKNIRSSSSLMREYKSENDDEDNEHVVNPYEEELSSISMMVKKLYTAIFKQVTSQTPMEMLAKVETAMEEIYNRMENVDQNYIKKRLTELEIIKNKEDRAAARYEQERRYYEKKMITLERATKPVKKPEGRRLNPRSYFSPRAKPKEEIEKEKLIQKTEEEFLFGPLYM